jgi:hypothetical protein
MKRFVVRAGLVLALLICCAAAVPVPNPDSVNPESDQFWVYRRNRNDKNGIQAVCTVVHLTNGTAANTVSGKLTVWTDVDLTTTPKVYKNKLEYTLTDADVTAQKAKGRSIQKFTWEGTNAPVAITSGAPAIRVYASLHKGSDKHKGHNNRRLILRCRLGANPMVMKTESGRGDCDNPPDDDVLEEEGEDPGDSPPYDDG